MTIPQQQTQSILINKIEHYCIELNESKGWFIEWCKQQIKRLVNQLIQFYIDENIGIYADMLDMDYQELLNEVAGIDEIRAFLAAYVICEDLTGYIGHDSLEQIGQLRNTVAEWACRSKLIDILKWDKLYQQINEMYKEIEDELTCWNCGRKFHSLDDMREHTYTVPTSQYPHTYGWDAPEERCKSEYEDDVDF